MSSKFRSVFGAVKPIIAMVHCGALPGLPLYDSTRGLDGLVEHAAKDLAALQTAGVDAVMFGNENDRPYEFNVDTASIASMAYVIGRLRSEIKVPFGVSVLWDPMSLPETPVLANPAVKHATVADVLKVADGCIVGSSLKLDGNTWNAVDPDRAARVHADRPRHARDLSA